MPKSLMFDMYKGYMRNVDEYMMDEMEKTMTQPDVLPEPESDVGDLNEPTT